MALVFSPKKLIPITLLLVITSIISFFVSNIGDPTQKNIGNNSRFKVTTAYLIAPLNESIEDILLAKKSLIPSKIEEIPWSFDQHAYWLKITIKNNHHEVAKLVSHFDNPMLDELSIFHMNSTHQVFDQQTQGDQQINVDMTQRTIPHFNFKIPAFDQTVLYVRIATSGIANTPIYIYKDDDFRVLVQDIHLLWGVFIGVAIMVSLYNLVIFYSVKDIVYLIYTGYILTAVALMGVVLGYGFYLFPEPLQLSLNMQVISLNCLVLIFATLFLIYFLEFQLKKQRLYWLAMIAIFMLSLLLIVSLWLPEYISAPIYFMLLPAVYLICLTLVITKIRTGIKWGKLYIYSWIPLLIGAVIQPLLLTGKIEYSFFSQHAFMIALLAEIVLMAMALADRMRFQKEQVLYHATHDIRTGLPNITLLEEQLSRLIINRRQFATCLIEIENYHTLAPYMQPQELQTLENSIIHDISPLIEQSQNIFSISHINERNCKLAKVVDGRLMFIVETSDRLVLTAFLNKLQSTIVRDLELNGLLLELKTSIGICFSAQSEADFTANEFIQHSLLAIEQNRENGDHLHYYHEVEVLSIKDHLALACELQSAMRNNQLHLYHQPQINLKTGNVYGSEVLLRWQHPEHGFISPELFVRIAENTGLINELTRWVIDCAFRQLQGLHKHDHLSHQVSINISGKDIILPNFLSYVQEKMKAFNIPRNAITFELTESVMVSDFKALDSLMGALSQMGINISIDDYGTGYSSLSYISKLKFDELKIDKAFIVDLDKSQRNLTIVKTTIDMANNLNLKVVAEGVESQLIQEKLRECGCDISQGYYYSQPLPFNKYLLWLDHYNRGNKLF